MNNSAAILRALIVYAICVPLAIIVGYASVSLANSPTYSNFGMFGVLALILSIPIFLRWHYPMLVLCWNLPMMVFFLPGRPEVYLPMMAISLGISILQRTMNKNMRFIPAPEITWPLLWMIAVVLVTAKMTGGIGLHALGNTTMGGKKYVMLLAGIFGFFALCARRIPPDQAGLYLAFFLLGPCLNALGDLIAFVPSSFYFIFLFIHPDFYAYEQTASATRFTGVASMAGAVGIYMMARYGVSGIFTSGRTRRLAVFFVFMALAFFGGFRSILFNFGVLFSILFVLEGLHRTKLLPVLIFAGLLGMTILFPMANRLPYTFQRVLSFLPVKVDARVKADAQASLDWRIRMWTALLPQVPAHLLLGKGYAISQEDFQLMGQDTAFHSIDPAEQGLAISGDYHNGPLSVLIPFGIWGAIAFVWFIIAGIWALNQNRLYGDPALQTINNFLFAMFLTTAIAFFVIFGALSGEMAGFAGLLGMSISLNNGICRPARKPALTTEGAPARLAGRPRLQPAFQGFHR